MSFFHSLTLPLPSVLSSSLSRAQGEMLPCSKVTSGCLPLIRKSTSLSACLVPLSVHAIAQKCRGGSQRVIRSVGVCEDEPRWLVEVSRCACSVSALDVQTASLPGRTVLQPDPAPLTGSLAWQCWREPSGRKARHRGLSVLFHGAR